MRSKQDGPISMSQILRTAVFSLAVLLFFLSFQAIRSFTGESVCNARGGWGVSLPSDVLVVIGAIVLILVLWFVQRNLSSRMGIWWALLFAGGSSNLYERISFGCVTDYFHIFSWFPLFNMADVLLTIAVLGFLWENRIREKLWGTEREIKTPA